MIVTKTSHPALHNPDLDKTTTTDIKEPRPDLYFRVTMPDGSIADTRQLPGGFILNFTSARVGTLDHPLTFTFGGGITLTQP